MSLFIVVALTAGPSCSDLDLPTDPRVGVTFSTDRDSYAKGESVRLTLYNGYYRSIVYSPHSCDVHLERFDDAEEGWELVWSRLSTPCLPSAAELAPQRRVSVEFGTDRTAITVPGQYRFVREFDIHEPGSETVSVTVYSNTNEIGPPEEAARSPLERGGLEARLDDHIEASGASRFLEAPTEGGTEPDPVAQGSGSDRLAVSRPDEGT